MPFTYSDESHFGQKSQFLGVGLLITDAEIPTEVVETALEKLSDDPDRLRPDRQEKDERTLQREPGSDMPRRPLALWGRKSFAMLSRRLCRRRVMVPLPIHLAPTKLEASLHSHGTRCIHLACKRGGNLS